MLAGWLGSRIRFSARAARGWIGIGGVLMKVWLASIQGMASLKIEPETEAERDYLLNMDIDVLTIRRVKHRDESWSLNIEPRPPVVPAKIPSRR